MAHYTFFFLSSLLTLAAFQGNQAVEYKVTNNAASTPGGTRFTNQIGEEYARQIMAASTNFIWGLFQQTTDADKKAIQTVSLVVVPSLSGNAVAVTSGGEIRYSAQSIDDRTGFAGVVYHEMAHVWQWFGNGQAPTGLTEGIADFVRLKAGYVPGHWVRAGQGDKWDHGYDVTARFLDYCEGLKGGFVAELNKKMRNGYNDSYFVELLGKTPDQLWSDYKAKYGGN